MNTIWFACALVVLVLATASTAADFDGQKFLPNFDRVISDKDFLLVRGRMRECMSWDGRLLEVHNLSEEGSVRILGLREIEVVGKTELQVFERLRALLDETFRFEETPLVTVEADRFPMNGPAELSVSTDAMKTGDCPVDPPKAPHWWPRGEESQKRHDPMKRDPRPWPGAPEAPVIPAIPELLYKSIA